MRAQSTNLKPQPTSHDLTNTTKFSMPAFQSQKNKTKQENVICPSIHQTEHPEHPRPPKRSNYSNDKILHAGRRLEWVAVCSRLTLHSPSYPRTDCIIRIPHHPSRSATKSILSSHSDSIRLESHI